MAGGWRRLAAVGGWRLAVGGWRLAVGGWRSFGAVLNKKRLGFFRTALQERGKRQRREQQQPPPPHPPTPKGPCTRVTPAGREHVCHFVAQTQNWPSRRSSKARKAKHPLPNRRTCHSLRHPGAVEGGRTVAEIEVVLHVARVFVESKGTRRRCGHAVCPFGGNPVPPALDTKVPGHDLCCCFVRDGPGPRHSTTPDAPSRQRLSAERAHAWASSYEFMPRRLCARGIPLCTQTWAVVFGGAPQAAAGLALRRNDSGNSSQMVVHRMRHFDGYGRRTAIFTIFRQSSNALSRSTRPLTRPPRGIRKMGS